MMTHRRTARLRLRKPDSCCETCRLVEETNAGLLGRRASLGPAGCRNARRITGLRSVSPRGAVEVPGLWTPGQRRAEFEGRRGENRQLREEREILAKATAWFARETGPGRSTGS